MRRTMLPAALLALAAVLGGCSASDLAKPNLPPDTRLFVQFDASNGVPHTVPYEVKLSWLGLDEDGFVVAYEIRFKDPSRPADTTWVRTTRTDSTIAVATPTGASTPEFEVRAIDDGGAIDATPASQDFSFENERPTIRITNKLIASDSTYGSVTINWVGVDPDGDAGRLVTRVWLDGNEANARLVSNRTTFTVPTIDFRLGANWYSGPRKLYVQAIDPGGFTSLPDSMTWYVRRPCPDTTLARGRVLLIDDVPVLTAGGLRTDSLWVNNAGRVFPAGSIGLLRLATTQPFRSAADMLQTFQQFDAVIWYRGFGDGYGTSVNTLMRNNESALRDYLDWGGTLVIEGLNLFEGFETAGTLSQRFLTDYAGCDSLRTHRVDYVGASAPESWSIRNAGVLRSSLAPGRLRLNQNYTGGRALAPHDTNQVLLWGLPGEPAVPGVSAEVPAVFSDSLRRDELRAQLPVAVRARQAAGGDAVVIALPLFGTGGFSLADPAVFLDALLRSLPPPPSPRQLGHRASRDQRTASIGRFRLPGRATSGPHGPRPQVVTTP